MFQLVAAPRSDWLHHLAPFSLSHVATVALFAAMMAAFVLAGLRARRLGHEPALRRRVAVFIALWQAASIVWWMLPSNLDWAISLPIQLCDLAGPLAAVTLLTQKRWARSLLYFWGLGLCTQAFITPVNLSGPASPHYWFFWMNHAQIVGAAVYDLVVLRWRPAPRDAAWAFCVTTAYAALLTPLNLAFDWNYLYLGRTVAQPGTVMELLGPWPWRVLTLACIVAILFAVMTFVWPLARFLRRGAQRAAPR